MPKRNRKRRRDGNASRPYSSEGGKAAGSSNTNPAAISRGSSSDVCSSSPGVTRVVRASPLGSSSSCLPPLVITYTNELSAIEQWLQEHVLRPDAKSKCILGMDTESKPCFTTEAARAARNPDTLQLAVADGHCVVIHLSRMDKRIHKDSTLVHVLKSQAIPKAGVGVVDDALELHKNHSLDLCCRLDLRDIARFEEKQQKKQGSKKDPQQNQQQQPPQKLGLKVLAEKYVEGLVLPKKKKIQMSNWATSLTNEQIEYAAADAFAGAAAVSALANNNNQRHHHTHQSLIELALTDELDISMVEQDRAMKKQQRKRQKDKERREKKTAGVQDKDNKANRHHQRRKGTETKNNVPTAGKNKKANKHSVQKRAAEHSNQHNAVAPVYQQLSTSLRSSR